MNRHSYYEGLKELARTVRASYQLTSETVSLSSLRKIYKVEGITIDIWKYKLKTVRGAYLIVDGEPYVLLNGAIAPKEPRIFTLAHELKHHYCDRSEAEKRKLGCQDVSWSDGSPLEIGAEIFASELIYPEAEFLELIQSLSISPGACEAADVVKLKKSCPAPVSYASLVKRLEWFRIVSRGAFHRVRFQKLEDSIYGVPPWRQHRQGA